MKTHKKLIILFLWLLALAAPSNVLAQDKTDVETQARELMARGLEAEEEGRTDDALAAYTKSFELYPSYDVAGNMGLILVKQQRYLEAAEHLSYCLRHYPTGENRELKALLERNLATAESYIAKVQLDISQEGASIFVDGERIGTSPLDRPIYLMAGEYSVRAERHGESAETTFSAEKATLTEVSLKLEGPSEEAEPAGRNAEKNPERSSGARTGKNWVPAYVLGGVTIAALGTSMVFRGLAGGSSKKKDDAQSNLSDYACAEGDTVPAACQDIEKYGDRANQQATIADATLIGAVVLGTATLGYVLFRMGKKAPDERAQASLSIERGGISFSLTGHF